MSNHPANNPEIDIIALFQITAEKKSGRIVSDMKECTKKRCGTEFQHAEKNCIHRYPLVFTECLERPNNLCEHG